MLDLLTIALEAHCHERNHHRRYEVSVGRDLLDHWVVTIRFGRVGQSLQRMQWADPRPEVMRTVLTERLRRRLSARRRLGCPYVVRELTMRDGVWAADWLLPQVCEAFALDVQPRGGIE
ncbi:MAG: WGR domain-containing protein [Phycisphaerales bacterium]|nr:WGR domain-containing protein [Phycisphaerales bacterium]